MKLGIKRAKLPFKGDEPPLKETDSPFKGKLGYYLKG